MNIDVTVRPELDPDFLPAVLWNREYKEAVRESGNPVCVSIALVRPDDTCTIFETCILPFTANNDADTLRYLERILKFLLWQRGGYKVLIAGCDPVAEKLAAIYAPGGVRAFDYWFFGDQTYLQPLEISACRFDAIPVAYEAVMPLGRHTDGCRIGFDLGGSDRKCAALKDGEVLYTEEVEWNPYFENDSSYHIEGINESLQRAASYLPRVDAIGGSSAGVYVNNEVRVASLFRGVSPDGFEQNVRRIFFDLKERWGGVPFEVVNDGEVTALAGSMSLEENAVLGLAMGTSEAVGYVTPEGTLTPMLNELAFAPVDYRADAPTDEWSGDVGCGVQYFSQQAVARLAPAAGFEFPKDMLFPEQLIQVQKAMASGDERAKKIYSTIGTYLGYTVAHYAEFYEIRKILLLGRVMSGKGGSVILQYAREVLAAEFPIIGKQVELVTLSEKDKRHGQAVAAATLPMIVK
ncbi:ROK family protein [Haloferula sp.]|uniref:ROK family protein n=1 Tax=Haloferula sp. TaxID=2497595 RepID=UPI00329EF391